MAVISDRTVINQKKILTLAISAIIAVTAIASASLAYLTDTKTADNTFTMGNVKITLDETDINNPEGDRVTKNTYEVYPGAVVTKDPIVHNVGKNPAYIRATVNVCNWMNLVAAYYPDFKETFPNDGYKAALNLLVGELGEGWSVVDVVAGDTFTIGQFDAKFILKYEGELAPGADTPAMFNTVTIPTGIDNARADSFKYINVVAQAIQTNGFDSWEAAFEAFDA